MRFNAIFHSSMNSIFETKNYDSFLIYGSNIDCECLLEPPHRGGSNKHPQSIIVEKNKRNNAYPCKPHFSPYKVRFNGLINMMCKEVVVYYLPLKH